MILGYVIFSVDIKYSMYSNILLKECDGYSNTFDINRIDPAIKIRTTKNISSTYDNFTIVSEKFKDFCEKEQYDGLEFVILPKSSGLYWFKVHNVVEYDAEASGTEFINYNATCKGYEEIIGATPACLKAKVEIKDGFFRTDICFGSFASKKPLYIVGKQTLRKLQQAGFKEIDFDEILDKYD